MSIQLSLSPIKIPKYLTWVVVYNHFLHNLSLRSVSNCLCLGLNKITPVFATFKDILFAFNQRASLCKYSVDLFYGALYVQQKVSSAK